MDRRWIQMNRVTSEYKAGVESFIKVAIDNNATSNGQLKYTCKFCANNVCQTIDVAHEHMIVSGFCPDYTIWVFHGESTSSSTYTNKHIAHLEEEHGNAKEPANTSNKLVKDADQSLYPGCKMSLSTVLTSLNDIKCCGGMSDESISMLLKLVKGEFLVELSKLPDDYTQMKKMIAELDTPRRVTKD